MNRRWTRLLISGAVALTASGAIMAQDYSWRPGDEPLTFRIGRAPEWNPGASEGHCRLRVFVDDRATIQLRGDQIFVTTRSGRRSFDQGSHCNQPLPFHRVQDFRVVAERGRGSVMEVTPPNRRNNFTGSITVDDPRDGGATYVLDVNWLNAEGAPRPLASNEPYPYFDETRACQDRVRGEFLSRNRDDAYLEFRSDVQREEMEGNRERISGRAWARNRNEGRPLTYECVLNERTNRVIASSYQVRGPNVSSALR